MELRLAFQSNTDERLLTGDEGILLFNAGAPFPPNDTRSAVEQTVGRAKQLAKASGNALNANSSPQLLNDGILSAIKDIDLAGINNLRSILANYTVAVRDICTSSWLPDSYSKLDLLNQDAVLRYGNVELRVLENYLTDCAGLRIALSNILDELHNETFMYAPGKPSNYLATDDVGWNLRALMTNAGFYIRHELNSAWATLEEWAARYSRALQNSYLASYPAATPFSFGVQRILWERSGYMSSYISHPNAFDVYDSLAGYEVLFVSPLAHLVEQQILSGRLRYLFKDYVMPDFSLRTLPAWISTWPNQPHADWSETFARMCEQIEIAFKKQPFQILMASCGCYGLPICDFVRSAYGCKTLYLGNIANAYFGIRQSATRTFMIDRVDATMWCDGDLGRITNFARIDGGRYI